MERKIMGRFKAKEDIAMTIDMSHDHTKKPRIHSVHDFLLYIHV